MNRRLPVITSRIGHLQAEGSRPNAPEMRCEVLDHYLSCIAVGEAPLASISEGRALTHPEPV